MAKGTLASQIAQAVNGREDDAPCGECDQCKRIERGVHPDVQVIAPAQDARSGRARVEISIDRNNYLPTALDGVRMTTKWINRSGEILLAEGNVGVILSPVGSGPGDINNNCIVNVEDLLLLLSEWGESISVADINLDGTVNVTDLLALLGSWG